MSEITMQMKNGYKIPIFSFGMYLVDSEDIVLNAIKAGYRHFDSASSYNNEGILGGALAKVIHTKEYKRSDFFITSKIWTSAQREGSNGVRKSCEKSLTELGCGYLDLLLIHWPAPGYHVDAYKMLEVLQKEGKVRSIGISNYSISDFEELHKSNITIQPVVHQFEVSPGMYRPDTVNYFQNRDIVVCASKALKRGECFGTDDVSKAISSLASKYERTAAQVMLRWATQKQLVVISKTERASRMNENISITDFVISSQDMSLLDCLTSEEAIKERNAHEERRKLQ